MDALQIGAHVLGQHRYRAPGDDGKSGHVQDRLDDDLDMEVSLMKYTHNSA